MASSVLCSSILLLLLCSVNLRHLVNGDLGLLSRPRPKNVCSKGFYAKKIERGKHRNTVVTKGKYICRECGKCMDGLRTIKLCDSWADTQCGGCEHEDLGFVFDMTTKSCQHPDVLSGKVAPGDIWLILGALYTTTEPLDEGQTDQSVTIRTTSDDHRGIALLTLPTRSIEFNKAATNTFTGSSETSALALTVFGTFIILFLSLFVLTVVACKLQAAQEGFHTLFPCFIYGWFKRIFTRERTHMQTVSTSLGEKPTTSSNQRKPGNVLQLSKDSDFPETTSLYQIRTDSPLFFLPKSSSCHIFGYDMGHGHFAGPTLPHTPRPTRDKVNFCVGHGRSSFNNKHTFTEKSSEFRPLNRQPVSYDSIDYDDVSKSDVSDEDTEDEYGAWRAFMAQAQPPDSLVDVSENSEHHDRKTTTEIYLPSITTL
ncbi:uncharacterized protein LOC117103679 [Anneissia japonica]|uniref:uncharacterized protein LOC117103679 n=1 Tax=Anneissia japonica TaxID=1529436 RepID=UPI0014256075|nr:uncharacterized protein LOC117103679 [Anneissia japonica]